MQVRSILSLSPLLMIFGIKMAVVAYDLVHEDHTHKVHLIYPEPERHIDLTKYEVHYYERNELAKKAGIRNASAKGDAGDDRPLLLLGRSAKGRERGGGRPGRGHDGHAWRHGRRSGDLTAHGSAHTGGKRGFLGAGSTSKDEGDHTTLYMVIAILAVIGLIVAAVVVYCFCLAPGDDKESGGREGSKDGRSN